MLSPGPVHERCSGGEARSALSQKFKLSFPYVPGAGLCSFKSSQKGHVTTEGAADKVTRKRGK